MFTKTDRPSDLPGAQSPPETQAAPAATYPQPRQPTARAQVAPSVISSGLTVIGNLESDGEIQVDGTVQGDIHSQTVTVGEGAKVKGSIHADSVHVAGSVEGEVDAHSVAVSKSGRMLGDVIHETLQVEAGAYLDGHCRRKDAKSSESKVTAIKAGGGSPSPRKDSPSTEGPDGRSSNEAQASRPSGSESEGKSA